MSNTWEQDIIQAFENLGGAASYDKLYEEIAQIRSDLSPQWKSTVRRIIQDLSSDSHGFKHGEDLFFSVDGLGKGAWGLRSHTQETPPASDLLPDDKLPESIDVSPTPNKIELPEGNAAPDRVWTKQYRVLRDTELARQIKLIHQNKCQICGLSIQISKDVYYSEAHHIIPLGKPHGGPDVPGNIIVLCPNHHAMMDYGTIRLEITKIRSVDTHALMRESIDYHNHRIFNSII